MEKNRDRGKFFFLFGTTLFFVASVMTALIINTTVPAPYTVYKEYTTDECVRAFDPEGIEVSCDEAAGKIYDIVWVKSRKVEEERFPIYLGE